ncbi:Miniconductance mechanosensitive channel MscM [BD1-7 clade bacterium]|uniref:Small-conductance mechanosensitive channel n=1 Tax=BD1-7 clade bacterium TaxID=2029982 RepID=A0A5S9PC31_9GAMM|nr:Miniconductance mechanosensitive channel MscM [BD1-7 clade bacterium]
MPPLTDFIQSFVHLLPSITTAVVLCGFLFVVHRFLIAKHRQHGNESMLTRQLSMLVLTIICAVIFVVVLPIAEGTRNQILTLIGIALSGVIAFSSTTIFSNIMAGFMLRVTRPFTTGTFVTIGEYSGKVVERGLLDTEIQTEDRRLVSLPNAYVVSQPVSVVSGSGALISASLSLGYDIDHRHVEELLLDAIVDASLEDPFVQIVSLDDFSIVYRANGLLKDPKGLISARSDLHRCILVSLHQKGVEIVSPSFMNQRVLPSDAKVLPAKYYEKQADKSTIQAEDVVFEKAQKAEDMQTLKKRYKAQIQRLEEKLSESEDSAKAEIKADIAKLQERLDILSKKKID